jgi:hypothetical protein
MRASLFEAREPFLQSIYLGGPALALVAAGVVSRGLGRRKRFLVLLLAVALLTSLGRHTPVYGALTTLLPPLRILRYPVKAMAVAAFAWALLAGAGFDEWRRRRAREGWRWAVPVAGPVTLVALAGVLLCALLALRPGLFAPLLDGRSAADAGAALAPALRRLGVGAALTGLVAIAALARSRPGTSRAPLAIVAAGVAALHLLVVHHNVILLGPKEIFTHRPEAVDLIRQDAARAPAAPHTDPRVYVYDYIVPEKALAYLPYGEVRLRAVPRGWDPMSAAALGQQMYLAPFTAGRWNLGGGFERDARLLFHAEMARLSLRLRELEGSEAHSRLLRLGGVTHVVALHEKGFEDLDRLRELPGLLEQPIRIFRVPGALPRTYAVGAARVADGAAALALLESPKFDPLQEVLLAAGPPAGPAPAGFRGSSRIAEARADRLRIDARLEQPGYVVILDTFDPGWRATVDGRDEPVYRANLAFRAVRVPAGSHRIELVYRPRALAIGLVVAGLALAAAVVLLLTAAAPARRSVGR